MWILFHYECQAQSQLEEASWLHPRVQHPLEIDLFFQSAAETDPALRARGQGMWFWPPRRRSRLWEHEMGADSWCPVSLWMSVPAAMWLLEFITDSGLSWRCNQELAEEQNNWFEAISVNQTTHSSSLTASPRAVSPHWHGMSQGCSKLWK